MSNVEISAMYEALDNMDDYALMAGIKPTGPHKVLTDAIAELEQLRRHHNELLDALEIITNAKSAWEAQASAISAIGSVKGQP